MSKGKDKQTVRIYEIQWETDGESPRLPTELKLTLPKELASTEYLLEYLSDTFGWLVSSMQWDIQEDKCIL